MSPSSHRLAAVVEDSTPDPASSVRTIVPAERAPESSRQIAAHFLSYARGIESAHPGYFAALGTTSAEYAAGMVEPGRTLEESVAAGEMSAAEARFVEGCATRQDLLDLGYPPVEMDAVLEDQKARACASSG